MPQFSRFSIAVLLYHCSETFRRGTILYSVLCFRKFPLAKTLWIETGGGECQDFPSKNFVLTVPKHFVEEPFCAVFQKISGSKKVYGQEMGEYQDFPSKIVCLTVPKNFVGEPFRVSLISGIEKLYASEGYAMIFPIFHRSFFVSL